MPGPEQLTAALAAEIAECVRRFGARPPGAGPPPLAAGPVPERPSAGHAPASVRAVGVDVVDVPRLARLGRRWGDSLLAHLFTEEERRAAQGGSDRYRWESLGGRLAAKEAVKKVLGSQGEAAAWRDLEILKGRHGQPVLALHNGAAVAVEHAGCTHVHLSITHEAQLAVAVAVGV
ncbi:holo-ACP synthase [Streptomyces sp. NPDC019443]|uniref:holo-ACP synthase n=1 Tax=Streptomyces sp. NPDC019443 TaxID=3365061 RepID=UPI0037A0C021